MHANKLYGYIIDSSVLYFPSKQQLINHSGDMYQLRHTMSELLNYLIHHAGIGMVSDNEIITNVWDKNNLSGSYNRLYQVMQNLNRNLSKLGIENDVFMRIRGKGYYLMDDKVIPLYTRVSKKPCYIDTEKKRNSHFQII